MNRRAVFALFLVACATASWAQAPTPMPTATATPTATPLPGCFAQVRALCPTCSVSGVEVRLVLGGGNLGGRIAYRIEDSTGARLERLGDCEINLEPHDVADLPTAARAAIRDWVRRRIRAAEGLAP